MESVDAPFGRMKPEGGSSAPQTAPKRKQAERMAGTAAEQAAIEQSLQDVTRALISLLLSSIDASETFIQSDLGEPIPHTRADESTMKSLSIGKGGTAPIQGSWLF